MKNKLHNWAEEKTNRFLLYLYQMETGTLAMLVLAAITKIIVLSFLGGYLMGR